MTLVWLVLHGNLACCPLRRITDPFVESAVHVDEDAPLVMK
jgi:hypothetical protein